MVPGQIVFSKAGRDKKKPYIVMSSDDNYAFLADGRVRPFDKQKKKKLKHIQPTNTIIQKIKNRLEDNLIICDTEIMKALEPYYHKEGHKEG